MPRRGWVFDTLLEPSTYEEEEMDRLMNAQGLSYEEVKEIAEISHRTLDK